MTLFSFLLRTARRTALLALVVSVASGASSAGMIALINASLNNSSSVPAIIVIGFIGLGIIKLTSRVLSQRLLIQLAQGAVFDLRMRLSHQILATPLLQLEAIGAHRLLVVLAEDVPVVANTLQSIPILSMNGAIVLVCLIYLGWLSWPVLAVGLGVLIGGLWLHRLMTRRASGVLRLAREQQDRLFHHFKGLTEGSKELKLHAQRRQVFLSETLQSTADSLRNHNVSGLTIYTVAAGWADLLLFGFVGVLLFAMPALQSLSPAVLTACVLTSLYLMTPLAVVMNLLPNFGLARAALHKIHALGLSLGDPGPEAELPGAPIPANSWRLLELRNVTHAYHVEREDHGFTLGPINLAFRPGELIFLVGGNGSGKTTLAKLLAGLYSPETGTIALDGQPITDATRERYRQLFSMVFADFYLFEELTGLGAPELEARGQEYLARLQLDHKVHITDGHLSTTALSQGQRKRLALLTAYLEDRPFYIFDEWAADQDPGFKELFYTQLLPELKARGKTILVITHDDRYFHLADRLLKLDYGQLTKGDGLEEAVPAQPLLSNGGLLLGGEVTSHPPASPSPALRLSPTSGEAVPLSPPSPREREAGMSPASLSPGGSGAGGERARHVRDRSLHRRKGATKMRAVRRILSVLGILIVIVVLVVGGGLTYMIRAPMPAHAGTFQAPGLNGKVDVYRDSWGIPYIYADTTHDLFFAQGYVHAQDRFWQMESRRRLGAGRLSELFGPVAFGRDRLVRTLGWRRIAEQEAAMLDADTRAVLQSYADGVNAYINSRSHWGLEFEILKLRGVNYTPEPWTIADTLTWSKAMSWLLAANLNGELREVGIVQKVGMDAAQAIAPRRRYPVDSPVTVLAQAGFDYQDTVALQAELEHLQLMSDAQNAGLGSNVWVIGGSRTDTGKPYLVNDIHLDIEIPSLWYEVNMQCNQVSAACPYAINGFSFAGVPGIVTGHNQRIAWGIANVGADVQDLYVERLNPDNQDQYEVNGEWRAIETRPEEILVRGQFPPNQQNPNALTGTYDAATGFTKVVVPVRITRHGPLIDTLDARAGELNGTFGTTTVPENHAAALRWPGLEPVFTFRALLKLARAQNFEEFREALREFDAPTQNFMYADVDGNIGYQMPGRIPIRTTHDGRLPVPGWTDEYEWQGYIPFEELPTLYNPESGYILNANNAAVGDDYPYLIAANWDPGYRAQRIEDMITARDKEPITIQYLEQMLGDNVALPTKEMLSYLTNLTFDDPELQTMLDDLKAWDLNHHMDSNLAAFYSIFWVEVKGATFEDEIPTNLWPGLWGVMPLLQDPTNPWWDNVTTTDVVEQRDDTLRTAFAAAYATAKQTLGPNKQNWKWGDLHTATFRNSALGRSGIAPIEALFNRGPVAISGTSNVINASNWPSSNANAGNRAIYQDVSAASTRMVLDVSNFNNSISMHTTGQSGHPFSRHYDDMIDPWRRIEFHPELWERSAVEALETHLILTP